jgi:1-acyl-sn-glycerol-3-phosphate acyltransferase
MEQESGKRGRRMSLQATDGGRPNRLLIAGVRAFLFLYFLRFRLSMDKSAIAGLKPPYILIGNHASNLDAFLVARALHPGRMNYVTSAFFYRFRVLRVLLRKAGAIPKAHSQKDLSSLRMMMKSLKEQRILMIFPEGRRSLDGTGSRFAEALAKFVKRSGVPVVAVHIDGSYLAWPRWARKVRPGPIRIRFSRVFMPEDIKTAGIDQLHEGMMQALRFNDYEAVAESDARYRARNPADHLQELLHVCPDCLAEMVITGEGDRVVCTACGASAGLLPTGRFQRISGKAEAWPDVPAWFRLQRAVLAEKMRDPAFALRMPVCLRRTETSPDSPMRTIGSGEAVLDREGLRFLGDEATGHFTVSFPIQDLDMLPVSIGKSFELCDGDGVYWQWRPDQPEQVIRIEQYVDICLYGEQAPSPDVDLDAAVDGSAARRLRGECSS